MPTALRPNGINDAVTDDAPDDPAVVQAVLHQSIPDQRQEATVIEYWVVITNDSEDDPIEYEYECWTAAPDGAGGYTLGRQVGPTLSLTIPLTADAAVPTKFAAKLMWLDDAAQQAGTYVVTGLLNDGTPDVYASQSAALTSIGP